ncbi:MAG: branched-chain amino acid transport system substrate-binding protein [Acidimicrobiaceae bacterium]|nr:branched-chain amino acid transport system substrate-binding protein [Acidimicrobiaceae bacterium]
MVEKLLARLQNNPALAVLGLGGAAVLLLLVGVIGAFVVGGDDAKTGPTDNANVAAGPAPTDSAGNTIPGTVDPTATVPGGGPVTGPGGTTKPGAKTGPGGTTGTTAKPGSTTNATLPSSPGATRVGVGEKFVKWDIHAPETFGTLPVNFAEDPLKGTQIYIDYINKTLGGINGRTIDYKHFNDKYEVDGAKEAWNSIASDKPFFVSGTLGVDQVALVANEAKKAKIPYIAGGGSEALFKDIGMFQQASSYDTHLIQLAHFLAKESAKGVCSTVPCSNDTSIYSGKKKVAVVALNTDYILNAVNVFKSELGKVGLQFGGVTTVLKPTDQTSYSKQIQDLKGFGAEIVVPAQDPLTTSRIVAECQTQGCAWRWTISDFAHESDVALTLMQQSKDPTSPSRPAWAGVRGLAGGCYYTVGGASEANAANCGQLAKAHQQWVQIQGGGSTGEDDYKKDGQGGVAGYQLVHIWVKALADTGTDPTREKFTAALNTYEGYSDLISGPITYKGSSNLSHGATKMVVYEADTSNAWHQLGPGFVDGF